MHKYLGYDAFKPDSEMVVALLNEKTVLTTDLGGIRTLPKFYIKNEIFSGINSLYSCLVHLHANIGAQ